MLGGERVSATTLAHAREMLEGAARPAAAVADAPSASTAPKAPAARKAAVKKAPAQPTTKAR